MSANPVRIDTYKQHSDASALPAREAANMSNRMEHILQAMPSGIIILNGDGIVTEANPVARELLGRPLQGTRWIDIINRAFSPQDDDGHEVSLRNGRRVKIAITPLSPEPGQLIVLTDLTETRLLQKNLSHLQRLSALGKMVATLAHQVRTPLSAALLYASNLGSNKLSDGAKRKFQTKLVDRLNELEGQVNDMLLMAKGRSDTVGESTSFDTILSSVMANCEPLAEKNKCKLRCLNQSAADILANAGALSSAINNLVVNSFEAGADQVTLHCHQTEAEVVLDVVDNGKGLDSETQAKVLEPFYTTKAQGTGLGLAVVQSVVRNHGGQLELSCIKGVGCKISLAFPILKSPANLSVSERANLQASAQAKTASGAKNRRHQHVGS